MAPRDPQDGMWTWALNSQPPCGGAPAPSAGLSLSPGSPERECRRGENLWATGVPAVLPRPWSSAAPRLHKSWPAGPVALSFLLAMVPVSCKIEENSYTSSIVKGHDMYGQIKP